MNYKKTTNPKEQYRGITSIENKISEIIRPVLGNKKGNFVIIANLIKNWQDIIGDKFYQFCAPVEIKFAAKQKSNGTLHIKSYNSAIAFYIEANSNRIIEKIAAYYGYKIVSTIRIHQEPKNIDFQKNSKQDQAVISEEQAALIGNITNQIKNDELKLTLTELGKSILGKAILEKAALGNTTKN